MASGKSTYLRNVIASYVLGGNDWTPPSTVYVALSTATWTSTATGTSIAASEPAGGGYARISITNDNTKWSTPVLGVIKNNVEFTFPLATSNWGNIVSFYVVDAATDGNVLYGGDLFIQMAVLAGDTPKFGSDQITVTET